MTRWIAALSFLSVLTGCKEIDIVDGKIPSDYLSQAQAYMGQFKGSFYVRTSGDGGSWPSGPMRAAKLSLRLDEDRVLLEITPDMAGVGCQSKIGMLKQIEVSDDQKSVNRATFVFDAGKCGHSFKGRYLHLFFSKDRSRIQSIIDKDSGYVMREGKYIWAVQEVRGKYSRLSEEGEISVEDTEDESLD